MLNSWSEEWELQLNTSKTKVMLFGSPQGKLNLALQGVKIEQVESMKYLGVWLDTHLTFLQQAEYAASKASKAYWKVNRLIDGRRGLTPKTGIELYKSLIRWKFSIAAWATTSEKGIKLLEQVQARCLRAILDMKSHTSADTLDVVAKITPVRLRIQYLCTLEFTRISCKSVKSKILSLLQQAQARQSGITPMRHLVIQSKSTRNTMENMSVELEYTLQSSDILDGTIDFIDTVAPGDSLSSFSSKVESFVNNHLNQSGLLHSQTELSPNLVEVAVLSHSFLWSLRNPLIVPVRYTVC